MDAGLTCDMWEQCLGPALIQRREQLKMPRETHKGCFVFDAFTGNSSQASGFAMRRQSFLLQHNLTIAQIPPNTSAVLQPADGGHAYWRRLTDVYEDVAFGFSLNPLARARIEDVLQDKVGAAARDITNPEDVVLAELWAWRRLPVSLRRWVWVSRGFWSIEEMAKLHGIKPAEILQDDAEVTKLFS